MLVTKHDRKKNSNHLHKMTPPNTDGFQIGGYTIAAKGTGSQNHFLGRCAALASSIVGFSTSFDNLSPVDWKQKVKTY